MDPTLFDAIAHACLGRRAHESFEEDVAAYLRSHGVPEEDVAAILEAPVRLATYRMLVRNNLASVTFKMLQRTRARMGELFDATFEAFLDEAAPRTHYLRDVPQELLEFALPRWDAQGDVPKYLLDLARHELVDFAIATAPMEPPLAAAPTELALDRPLAFTHVMRLVRYAHAVHELPGHVDDRSVPAARDVHLLAYRDTEHVVRWLELTPLAATILAHLAEHHEPLGQALASACAEMNVSLDDAVLSSTAHLLADLGQRGVLLGAQH